MECFSIVWYLRRVYTRFWGFVVCITWQICGFKWVTVYLRGYNGGHGKLRVEKLVL